MSKVFDVKTPELSIKWGFIDFYLLISNLIKKYSLRGYENKFKNIFIDFEYDRKSVDDWIDFSKSTSHWDQDLFKYYENFQREGNRKDKIIGRHEVYLNRFLNELVDLVPLDQRRNFNENERIIIWRNAKQKYG